MGKRFEIARTGVLGVAAALLLSACSTLMPGGTATAPKGRALDPVNDDLASLVVVYDLPATLQPLPATSALALDFTSPSGERHVVARLALTDPGTAAETLPPPGKGRAYYFLGVAEPDKAALREAQGWAKSLGTAAAFSGSARVQVAPQLCSTATIAPEQTTYAVLAAAPGSSPLAPLMPAEPVSALLARNGTQALSFC